MADRGNTVRVRRNGTATIEASRKGRETAFHGQRVARRLVGVPSDCRARHPNLRDFKPITDSFWQKCIAFGGCNDYSTGHPFSGVRWAIMDISGGWAVALPAEKSAEVLLMLTQLASSLSSFVP